MNKPESTKEWRDKANPIKEVYAKSMRDNLTPPEAILWAHINNKQLGVKFRQQVIIRGYIVDFYCGSRRLAVEVDGKQHNIEYDLLRDSRIQEAKVRVLRFSAQLVFNDVTSVVEAIRFNLLSKASRKAIENS